MMACERYLAEGRSDSCGVLAVLVCPVLSLIVLADLRVGRTSQPLAYRNAELGCSRRATPGLDDMTLWREKQQQRFCCVFVRMRCRYKHSGVKVKIRDCVVQRSFVRRTFCTSMQRKFHVRRRNFGGGEFVQNVRHRRSRLPRAAFPPGQH